MLVLVAHAARAQDGVEAVLYGETLEPRPIELLALDADALRIVYLDAEGVRQEAGFDEVLRLTFPTEPAAFDAPPPVIATTDGQRILGRSGQTLHAVTGTDDVVEWRDADGMPRIGVSLDGLAWAVLSPEQTPRAASPDAPPTDDVLLLRNGERLVGFVDALGVNAAGFVIGDAADAVEIGASRIAALYMSNAVQAGDGPGGPGVWVTMRSGSRWRGTLGAVDGGVAFASPLCLEPPGSEGMAVWQKVRLGSADRAGQADWPVVSRIDLPSAGRRLVPLSSLPMSVVSGGEVFGVPTPPRLQPGGALALHAPVAVGYELPRGASRFVATAALAIGEDVPQERHAWAGCEVVVRVGDEELARVTLDAGHPEHAVNLALPAGTRDAVLTVTVEEGVNGPVLDRVELRDAEVLVTETGAGR